MDIKDYDLSGYSYGEIGDKIIDLCADYPPDFGKIIELMETGFDLNTLCDAEGYYENMLAKIFNGYPDIIGFREDVCEKCIDESCEGCSLNYPEADGRYLPHIVKLFLEHGFDCSRNNGRMGSVCLSYFIWSSKDKYILEAAKILLEAGANPEAISYEDSNDNALSMVATEESHVLCSDHEYELSNLYYTLYEIMDACVKKESFADIYNYDIAVGKRIDQIVLYGPKKKSRGIFPYNGKKNCFLDHIVFWCEGVPLCIDTFSNIISDPRIPQKAKSAENIEKYFPDCAGHKIREIKWDMFKFNSDGKIHNEELICICLDNGKRILFPAYFRGKINEQRYSYFGVI